MTRPTYPVTTFTRIVPQGYDECRRRVRTVFPAAAPVAAHGATRLHVDLPVGRRRVPMRVEIAPWTTDGATTGVELVPLRRVRRTARYFRAGHRLADDVAHALLGDRRPAAVLPGQTERRSVHFAA